jgi:hypothetical protein
LFIVLKMNSLGLAPPCFCEEPSLAQAPSENEDDTIPTIGQALKRQMMQGRPLSKKWDIVLGSQRTDYTDILAAAQVAAFGMNQQAFREAAKPYANFGHDQSSSTSINAAVLPHRTTILTRTDCEADPRQSRAGRRSPG